MRRLFIFVVALLFATAGGDVAAQSFLKNLGKSIGKQITNTVTKKTTEAVNRGVEKGIDKAVEKAESNARERQQQKAQEQAEDAYIFRDETFLFRAIGSSEIGLVRAQSSEEACQLICERCGKGFEMVHVPDDFMYFQAKFIP